MYRLGAAVVRNLHDALELEIRLGRRRAADVMCLVRVARMNRIAVRVGVDRRGGDAQLAARPHDADGDLATIGDQDLFEKLAFHSFNRMSFLFIRQREEAGSGSPPRPL